MKQITVFYRDGRTEWWTVNDDVDVEQWMQEQARQNYGWVAGVNKIEVERYEVVGDERETSSPS